MHPLLAPADIDLLREALRCAPYTSEAIHAHLGEAAAAALGHHDVRAALRVTAERRGPLATLIRLFICGETEPIDAVAKALAPLPIERAAALLEPHGDGVRAAVELEPYLDSWIVADLSAGMRPGRPLPTDHVLGVGGASTTLAGATMRHQVKTALDIGTGCGVQALHLAQHAQRVTATDVSQRALRFAATTAALAGHDCELLLGDLTAPVHGRRFDLVVSNPPFIVGPGVRAFDYRDSGRAGDGVCAELVAAAPALLNDGGYLQFLANWLHPIGQGWQDRVAGWLDGTGLDAWVIQREVSDPLAYVNLWLADAAIPPSQRPALAAAWLDWFDTANVEAVGFGLVTLRAGGHADPTVRIEDMRQPMDAPLGPLVRDWFARGDWLRAHPGQELLDARLSLADGVQLQQQARRDDGAWQVDRQVLALTGGARWAQEVDPVALALVGGCTGELPLRDVLDLLATAHDVPLEMLVDVALPLVEHLVERGFLVPAAR